MMSRVILLVIVFAACGHAKRINVSNAESVAEQPVPKTTVTARHIQGTFTCNNVTTHPYPEGIAADASSYYTNYRSNWWVRNDTIWKFEYPCKYLGMHRFEIRNGDSIYFDSNKFAYGKIELHKGDNGFTITQKHANIDDESKNAVMETEALRPTYSPQWWMSDSLDLTVLEKLKKDSLNYNHLVGDIELVTYYYPGDGEGYTVDFPLPLPKYMTIPNADSVRVLNEKKRIYIPIYGKPRLFKIETFSWNENDHAYNAYYEQSYDPVHDVWPRLLLIPGDWWTGLDFRIEYGGTDSVKNRNEIVRSAKNTWIELPAFKQIKNERIEQLASVMESLGYLADPALLRQYEDYSEYLRVVPVQSGKYYYYKLPADSQCVLRARFLTKEIKVYNPNNVKGVKGDKYFEKIVPVFDSIDFGPLKRVKNLSSYFFRKNEKIKENYTDYESGMAEIWEFGSVKDAELAQFFFNKYLQAYSELSNKSYGEPLDYKRKGKYLYVLYSKSNFFEEDYFLKKALDKIIASE